MEVELFGSAWMWAGGRGGPLWIGRSRKEIKAWWEGTGTYCPKKLYLIFFPLIFETESHYVVTQAGL